MRVGKNEQKKKKYLTNRDICDILSTEEVSCFFDINFIKETYNENSC